MKNDNTLVLTAIIAIAALGLVSVIAIDIMLTLQEADATRGCINPNAPAGGSIAVNASKGRCVH